MGMNNLGLQVIICVVLILYCVYMLYNSFKLYQKDKKGSAAFLQVHPDAKKHNFDTFQSPLMLVMAVVCFVIVFFAKAMTPDGQPVWMYAATYFCLGLIFVGLAMEVHINRTLWMGKDALYYGCETYRLRMISGMEEKKGIMKNFKVRLANGSDFEMPHKMGELVQETWQAWKAAKKEKRGKRRREPSASV